MLAAVLVATALMTALYAPAHLEGAFGSHLLEPHSDTATAPSSTPRNVPVDTPSPGATATPPAPENDWALR